jgi:hypothetical protein
MGLLWDLDLFHGWLVVGFNLPTPLKNDGVISSVGMMILPNMMGKSCHPVMATSQHQGFHGLDGIS